VPTAPICIVAAVTAFVAATEIFLVLFLAVRRHSVELARRSMLITGLGATIILWFAGVPMAVFLGLVTGLLTFVPNIGSVIALALAVPFSLPQGGGTVMTVVVGYMVLWVVESYITTPLIQQHQVSLPPAMLISFQAVVRVLFVFLGAAVASPLLAAVKTGVSEADVKDVMCDAGQRLVDLLLSLFAPRKPRNFRGAKGDKNRIVYVQHGLSLQAAGAFDLPQHSW